MIVQSDTCPTCGAPAHPRHYLGACDPASTWPNRAVPEKDAAEMGDFPCTYCRGMDHHDPICQLLVIRVLEKIRAGAKLADRSRRG